MQWLSSLASILGIIAAIFLPVAIIIDLFQRKFHFTKYGLLFILLPFIVGLIAVAIG